MIDQIGRICSVISDCPVWNYDGSSTGQADGCDSDIFLHPVSMYRDPFRGGRNKLVLCETYTHEKKSTGEFYKNSKSDLCCSIGSHALECIEL